jgi:hypothetical protein
MSKAIFRRKVESAGVTYDEAETQAIADIAKLAEAGFTRSSDISVSQRKYRGSWRFVATFTVSRSREVA